MTALREFLRQQYEAEFKAFTKALEGVRDEDFARAPADGGHSAAWHALHIAEWTRLLVLEDFTPTYAHLGWEGQAFTKQLAGPTRVHETSGRTAILVEVQAVFTQTLMALGALTDDALAGVIRSPLGERERLGTLGTQVRHIAYHRGQVKLVTVQNQKEQA